MHKIAKSIGVGVLIAVPVLAVATTFTVNVVATSVEAGKMVPYGQLVPVDDKEMNVVIAGAGDETIVLIPGLGTAAPGIDFAPLVDELQSDYRVIVIEPFGTGLSDATDTARTAANITDEMHEALQYLGVERFVLMAHSIGGIYALTYSASYPDDLIAFVGIDNSVPDQSGAEDPLPADLIATLGTLGITRVLTAIAGDPYEGAPFDEQAKEQMGLLTMKNTTAPTMVDEMQHKSANFSEASGKTFPADLPVLDFVSSIDTGVKDWVEIHRQQVESVDQGQLEVLDAPHYLHHVVSNEIAQSTRTFLTGLAER